MDRVVLSFIVLSAMRLHDYNWCVMILSETYKGRAFIKCHSRVIREQISIEMHFIHHWWVLFAPKWCMCVCLCFCRCIRSGIN